MLEQNITHKQQEILDYIKQMTLKVGYPPALREICEAVNLKSPSSVHSHLETLEKNGYIRRDPTKPRTIEIIDNSLNLMKREVVNIPIIDTIISGSPILSEQNIVSYFPMSIEMLPDNEIFILRVEVDSMIEAGIFEGDQVIVEQTDVLKNGDTVVITLSTSITLSKYFEDNGCYQFQFENTNREPVMIDEVNILGKVIGVIRMM